MSGTGMGYTWTYIWSICMLKSSLFPMSENQAVVIVIGQLTLQQLRMFYQLQFKSYVFHPLSGTMLWFPFKLFPSLSKIYLTINHVGLPEVSTLEVTTGALPATWSILLILKEAKYPIPELLPSSSPEKKKKKKKKNVIDSTCYRFLNSSLTWMYSDEVYDLLLLYCSLFFFLFFFSLVLSWQLWLKS